MATETQKPQGVDFQDEEISLRAASAAPASQKLSVDSRLQDSPTRSSSSPADGEPTTHEEVSLDDDSAKITESSSAEVPPGSSTAVPASDLEKKMRRAERFGMPMQLSEVDKRNSRAERFGTGLTSHGSDELKKAEELKRKARAERFGLQGQSVDEEEVKKKARSAKFASVPKADPAEEEKKKARAIRFLQTASGTPSHDNGNKNSEQQTSIVGEASGGA